MTEKTLPLSDIQRCLILHNFKGEVERHNLKKVYFDPAFFSFTVNFIREKCNIELSIDSPTSKEWRTLFKKVISDILKGRVTLIDKENSGEAGVVTPASAIYMAVYQLMGHDAPKVMYNLLEDILVEKLSGKENNAELLFYPISEMIIDKQVEVTKRILMKMPSICRVSFFIPFFCSKSKKLSKNLSKKCVKLLSKVCSEVESHE
jgi:hypothetical protein